MKVIFLTLIIFLISSCDGTRTQTNPYSNQSLQNATNRDGMAEDWTYCSDLLKRSDYETCLSDELKKLDENLDVEYSNALKGSQEYYTLKDVNNLVVAQKNWHSYRETNCQAEKEIYGAGTDAVGAGIQCRLRLTKQRLDEIKYIYGKK